MQSNCLNFSFSLLISSPHQRIYCWFYDLIHQGFHLLFSILFCSLTLIQVFKICRHSLKTKSRHSFLSWTLLFMVQKKCSLEYLESQGLWPQYLLKFLLLKVSLDKLWEGQLWIIVHLMKIYLQDESCPFSSFKFCKFYHLVS